MSQAPQHGSESWFSMTMGEKLAALKSQIVPRKIEKVEKLIKDAEARIKKAEASLKKSPGNKFADTWKAQVSTLTKEIAIYNELKYYDAEKDKLDVFVRKKFGLFAPLEGASMAEKEAKVRECFEQADTNGDKSLSKEEFVNIFSKLKNHGLTPEHIEGLFKQMDTNGNGVISFDEFFAYMFPKEAAASAE